MLDFSVKYLFYYATVDWYIFGLDNLLIYFWIRYLIGSNRIKKNNVLCILNVCTYYIFAKFL